MAHENSIKISIGILIFILLTIIIYIIILFETHKNQSFIFAPYVPPKPPKGGFYPLGSVTPLTQEQIDARNKIINSALAK